MAIVNTERRLTEPSLTGARLNALAHAALVYIRFVSIRDGLPFLSQLTNVNRFSKGETTETATELACFMVSDWDSCPTGRLSRRRRTRAVYI